MHIGNIPPSLPVSRADFHVVPFSGLWAVKGELEATYTGIFYTQVEATSYAINLARLAAASVVIHGRDGKIRDVWSYDEYAMNTPRIMVGR